MQDVPIEPRQQAAERSVLTSQLVWLMLSLLTWCIRSWSPGSRTHFSCAVWRLSSTESAAPEPAALCAQGVPRALLCLLLLQGLRPPGPTPWQTSESRPVVTAGAVCPASMSPRGWSLQSPWHAGCAQCLLSLGLVKEAMPGGERAAEHLP